MKKEFYTHQDLLDSEFKVKWLWLKYEDGYLRGSFEILSVGITYYVTDIVNMLRDKLKGLSDQYEYLSKAELLFPHSPLSMFYGFYVKANCKNEKEDKLIELVKNRK